jgi:hypothetical protein
MLVEENTLSQVGEGMLVENTLSQVGGGMLLEENTLSQVGGRMLVEENTLSRVGRRDAAGGEHPLTSWGGGVKNSGRGPGKGATFGMQIITLIK